MKVVEGRVLADGGTRVVISELPDGRRMYTGLDCRIPRVGRARQVFVGASSPDMPEARFLPSCGKEELEVMSHLEEWMDVKCTFLRLGRLLESDPAALSDDEKKERVVLELHRMIMERYDA